MVYYAMVCYEMVCYAMVCYAGITPPVNLGDSSLLVLSTTALLPLV